ncbi:MAG TPA: hypothetical protein VFN67_03245 [Polyangiales bacterium]|nr:hypothetical protein [Polyangiales bacterium]
MSHAERLLALQGMERAQFPLLFATVDGFARMTLRDLVPEGAGPLQAVRHVGRNSLPLFSSFEKRFYRLDTTAAVGGANFQSTSAFTGPGYFTALPSAAGGEVVIDYNQIPNAAPAGWPELSDNRHGIGRLVYGGMIDTLRRVSQHISIGAAQRQGHPPSAYFVLCRTPETA